MMSFQDDASRRTGERELHMLGPWLLQGRLRRLLALGSTIVVVVAGYFALTGVQDTFYSPEVTVKRMFTAIEARDEAALKSMSGGCYVMEPLCEPGALDTGYTPPTGWRITHMTYGDGSIHSDPTAVDKHAALVFVTYQLGGRTHKSAVLLRRDNSYEGLFRTWRIERFPGTFFFVLTVHEPVAQLAGSRIRTFGSDPIPREEGEREPGHWVLPGIYTLRVAGNRLQEASQSTITVNRTDRPVTYFSVPAEIKAGVAEAVDRQVKALLDECARYTQLELDPTPFTEPGAVERCPFTASYEGTIVEAVKWSVTQYPALRLEIDGGTLALRMTKPGRAVVKYRWTTDTSEPRDWTAAKQTIEFEVGGHVELTDDNQIKWVPRAQ